MYITENAPCAHAAPCHTETPTQPQGAFALLDGPIRKALRQEGYVTPTPIQEACIPSLLNGQDLVGTAQTGTGKTAAFALPLLQHLSQLKGRPDRGTPRALILAPTRELAAQIGDSFQAYGRFLKLSHTVVFGGVNQFHQVKALSRGVDILVATPGRLLDLMQQGFIHLNRVQFLVLDEVDRMLDMGFLPDIRRITEKVPSKRQTLCFSATMPPKVREIADSLLREPVEVSIAPEQPTVDRIDQKVLFVGKKNKDALLFDILRQEGMQKAIVFTQMKHAANKLSEKLAKAGIHGTAIHGNKTQAARTRALDQFRSGKVKVLVATDVAARGLDVDDITHVVNYDMPVEAETYVHRIGRTARAGASGRSFSLCCAEDRAFLRDIERLLGKPVPVDTEHPYHCEASSQSTLPPPRQGGGGGRRPQRRQGGKPSGSRMRRRGR